MKKLSLSMWVLVAALVFTGCSSDDDEKTYVLDLPDLSTEKEYLGNQTEPDETWKDAWGNDYYKNLLNDKSWIFEFDCVFTQWGLSDGFQFSSLTSGNRSAVTQKGVKKQTYITAFYNDFADDVVRAIRFCDEETGLTHTKYTVKGLYLTNSEVAYNTILNGNDIGDTQKFKEGDWYKVTIYNMNKTQKVEFYLADYRNGKSEVVNDWKWVDLSPLGETEGLRFELSSTDNDEWGIKTPAFFCIDGITLKARG